MQNDLALRQVAAAMQSSTRLAPAAPRQELKEALQELKDALYNRALELDGPASLKAMQSVNHAVAQDDGTGDGLAAARELASEWGVETRAGEDADGGAAPLKVIRSSIELDMRPRPAIPPAKPQASPALAGALYTHALARGGRDGLRAMEDVRRAVAADDGDASLALASDWAVATTPAFDDDEHRRGAEHVLALLRVGRADDAVAALARSVPQLKTLSVRRQHKMVREIAERLVFRGDAEPPLYEPPQPHHTRRPPTSYRGKLTFATGL